MKKHEGQNPPDHHCRENSWSARAGWRLYKLMMTRRKANAVFIKLIYIIFNQISYRAGGWDSPDAHLCRDLQIAVQILGVVIQISWLKYSLLRAQQSPRIVWSDLKLPVCSQGGTLYHASEITQPNTIILLPVAGVPSDTRLLLTVKGNT